MIGKKINQLATELAPVSTDLTIIGDPISGVSKKITLAQLGAIFSGAVSFYTNLAGFPALGDINVIYCAKDTKKLYLWDGTTYVEVFPAQALLDTYQLRSEKGVSNGYASLDSGGKVPISQLPSSIMEYKGTWNAATNTPTLANGTGDTGDVYICNVAGSVNFGAGAITFAVGDYVIYSGTIWQRSSGAVGTVTSVAASITGDAIGITGSPVTTSGTLAFAFAGTGAQYIKGDGTLATFPSTIAQAERLITEVYNSTGATLTKGTIVYINGGQGNLPTVTKALATGDSTSAQTFGVVQADITNMNNGYVVVAGKLSDLDTQAYTEGTQLYLSPTTAGTWTSTKPYAPNHLVYVGIVVRAHPTQGIVEIKIQNGYELDELHNVAAQTPTNNDGLFWESATSLWKNKSIATVLGYTPQAQLNGTGFVKASGTTISYDNSTYVTTDTFQTISASKTFSVGLSLASAGGTNQLTSFINTSSLFSGSGGSNVLGFNSANNIYFGKGLDNGGVLQWNNSAVRYYTLPDATGTIALVGGAGVGTVTSVGLSSATSGVTIGSTPITTSGTITLAIATASGSQQGLLSSTDWTTFNNKQDALTNPVTGTGTTNYLPKFTGTSTIGNSLVYDNGTAVAIGGTTMNVTGLNVQTSGANLTGTTAYVNINAAVSGYGLSIGGDGTRQAGVISGYQGIDFYTYNGGWTRSLTLNYVGNLGLGVSPSAWGSIFTALQIKNTSISAVNDIVQVIAGNSFYNGTAYAYIQNGFSNQLEINNSGSFLFKTAPSGTAGNAISFTQAMTLNASGNLSIGNTNDSYKLDVSGTGIFRGKFNVSTNISDYTATFVNSNSSSYGLYIQAGGTYNAIDVYNYTGGTQLFSLSGTGAATFSSSVTAGGTMNINNAANPTLNFITNSSVTTTMFSIVGAEYVGSAPFNANILRANNSSHIAFEAGGSERMRITSGGNVIVGASTSDLIGSFKFISVGNSGFQYAPTTGTYLRIEPGAADTEVALKADARSGGYPPMTFYTSASERMRITSGGVLLVNQTSLSSASAGVKMQINTDVLSTGTSAGYFWENRSGGVTSNSNWYGWYTTSGTIYMYNGSSNIASINASTGAYTALSDINKKKDFEDSTIGLNAILGLKPTLYRMKSEIGTEKHLGFIAQQVKEYIPQAYIQTKGEKEDFIGLDDRPIIAALVKSVQELKAELDTLKNK